MSATPIYTIGYDARELKDLLAVLQSNRIQYLLDVRTSPYSSYKPEFSKNALQNFLEANGVRYLFMGDTLGGNRIKKPAIPMVKSIMKKLVSKMPRKVS